MMIFLALVFAHLLADYPLQGDFIAKTKGQNYLILITHAGIWSGCVFTAAYLCGLKFGVTAVLLQTAIHAALDYAKCHNWYRIDNDPMGVPLWVDQFCHMMQLLVIVISG